MRTNRLLKMIIAFSLLILISGCGIGTPTPKVHMAVIENDVDALLHELNNGAYINEKESTQDFSPLLVASSRGNMTIIQILVENGANINQVSKAGTTPLIEATAGNRPKVVKYLLINGADKSYRTHNNSTVIEKYRDKNALEIAKMIENDEIVHLLETN